MVEPSSNGPAHSTAKEYGALLGVAQALVSHRDLPGLFQELASRLHDVIHFDHVVLILHDAASNRMFPYHMHGPRPFTTPNPLPALAPEDIPAGWVLETQLPLITATLAELGRWPWFQEQASATINSVCVLPLTTARRRLGVLGMGCKAEGAYEGVDRDFLQQLANQVAVGVENALAFQEIEELKQKLHKEKVYLEEELQPGGNFEAVVGESRALVRVLKEVETVAGTDSTVLICGETGTGKELIARAIHQLSPRRDRTFVKLNCAAIPTGLLEGELFGHEKGAFTGAITRRVGRFELADQGTLFLDEVGDIPLDLQPKLLRVLQEQEFERLGSTQTLWVNVRLIAATNRDLAQMVAAGQFRADLYYRLKVFPVVVPALRERPEDIARLVRHFTRRFADRMGKQIETIPASVMEALTKYAWPGNVRELENLIERSVILTSGPVLFVPLEELTAVEESQEDAPGGPTLADAERGHLLRVLREANWVLGGPNGAAARLGIKRSNLQWKMKKLGITRPM
jgi:formate hydrogenlyase transcriptional activator